MTLNVKYLEGFTFQYDSINCQNNIESLNNITSASHFKHQTKEKQSI